MAWYDDMAKFGSGLLDDVGEGTGNLIQNATQKTEKEATTNAATVQQPDAPVKDNHGNAVTGTQSQPVDKTLLYVGGGLGVAVVLIGLIIALKN
jgi:opacity protein-like surface antigen